MDLLVVSTWYPYPPDNGSRLRAYHLLRRLAASHRIRLVAGVQDDVDPGVLEEAPEALRDLCEEIVAVPWRWYREDRSGAWRSLLSLTPRSLLETENPPFRAAVAAALERPTDAVVAMQLGVAPFVPLAGRPVVIDEIEITAMDRVCRQARGAARLRAEMTRWKSHLYWRRALRGAAAVTAVSEGEAAAVRGMLGEGGPPVAVVPNGVDCAAYSRDEAKAVPGRLVYNGALTFRPNLDAVRWFAADVLPLVAAEIPEAHLVVTGRCDGLEIDDLRADKRVRLTGFLPDIRPALEEASLCVVPLRAGGGTRLKVLEAFAAGLPVVSTTLGAEGIDARNGEHLLLADDARELAACVTRLLRQPGEARSLARRARQLALEHYDWSSVGARLSDLLQCVREQERRAA